MCKMVSLMILCLIFGIVFESVIAKEILENSDTDAKVDKTGGGGFLTGNVKFIIAVVMLSIIGSCYVCAKCCDKLVDLGEVPATVYHFENVNVDFCVFQLEEEEEQTPEEKEIVEGSESPPPPTYEETTTH